jgi:hypothetical protein
VTRLELEQPQGGQTLRANERCAKPGSEGLRRPQVILRGAAVAGQQAPDRDDEAGDRSPRAVRSQPAQRGLGRLGHPGMAEITPQRPQHLQGRQRLASGPGVLGPAPVGSAPFGSAPVGSVAVGPALA